MPDNTLPTQRCFIAIPLPPPLQLELADLQRQLALAVPELKLVTAQNLHLTLQFLGDRSSEQLAEISRIMLSIGQLKKSFNLSLTGLDCFPNRRRPRIFWLGLDNPAVLLKLQQEVTQALEQQGLQPDLRPYRPHLTIGRCKTVLPAPERLCPFLSQPQRKLKADRMILYTSKLTARGAIHSPYQTVRFQ